MTRSEFNRYLGRLSRASAKNFLDPGQLEWPEEASAEHWYFSPELISLHGSPTWDALDEAGRKRLSFFEAVNFFSLNVHGEKYLISEISRILYRSDEAALDRYLLHFIEEEAKHMMYFAGFCERYAGKVYPDRTLKLAAGVDPELERFLLFARICLFEEIVDEYNRIMAADRRLAPIARNINRYHHLEESRHLAFGRRFLKELLEGWSAAESETRRPTVQSQLGAFLELTWKQYYNPDVYADAGIPGAFEVWQETYQADHARVHRQAVMKARLGPLAGLGLVREAP